MSLSRSLSLLSVLGTLACAAESTTSPAAPATPGDARLQQTGSGRLYRLSIPDEAQFPFYTRTELDPGGRYGYQTEEWAVVVFYRAPEQVPAGFNLLQFYDFTPAPPPVFLRPFGAASTVRGFGLFADPMGMGEPKQSQLQGQAVPIWFVPSAAFAALTADGTLTMAELSGAAGVRRGTATHFSEVAHTIAGHPNPRISITANGSLTGGGSFRYRVVWNGVELEARRHISVDVMP